MILERKTENTYEELADYLAGGSVCTFLLCPKNPESISVEAVQYLYIFTEESVLTYESLHIEQRKSHGSHLKLFEAMRKDIGQEDFLSFITHTEYLVTSFKNGNYTIEYCMSTLRDLVALLYQTMQQYQLDMRVVFGYDIRVYYKQIPNIDVFSDWITVLCEMILKNIRQKKQIMGQGYTECMKERKLNRAIELMKEGNSVKTSIRKNLRRRGMSDEKPKCVKTAKLYLYYCRSTEV